MAHYYNFMFSECFFDETFLSSIPLNSRVLEFGTATGYITRYLKEKMNCSVTGVELMPDMAAIASQYTEKMIVADIDSNDWMNEIEGTFDCILFFDVLEHLRTPEKTLNNALQYLSDKGCIITSIPNIAHNAVIMGLRRGKFEYTGYGLLDNTHIHFFTRSSMIDLFYGAGLTLLEENSPLNRPSITELKEYYIRKPLSSISLLLRKDAHVYQFVCKWGKKNSCTASHKNPYKGIRLSLSQILLTLLLDPYDYLKDKYNFKLPEFIAQKLKKYTKV